MKRQDRLPRVSSESNRSGLSDIGRTSRPINCERYIQSLRQTFGHLRKRAAPSASGRPSRGTIPESLDEATRVLGIPALARHHDYTALAPEPGCAKYAHMPKGEYCPVAARQYGIEVMVAPDFPSHRRTNEANQQKESKVGNADYDAVALTEAGEG
jgi:hypothetical protein